MESPNKIKKTFIGSIFKNSFIRFSNTIQIIIMYHRVVDKMPGNLHDPYLFVTSDTLKMHVTELKKFFAVVPLGELLSSGNVDKRLCVLTFDDGWNDNYDIAYPVLYENKVPATIFLPVADIGTAHWFWFEHIFFLANAMQSSHERQQAFIVHLKNAVPQWKPEALNIPSVLEVNEMIKKLPSHSVDELILTAYEKFKIEPSSERIVVDWEQVSEMGRNGISFGSHGLQHDILPLLDSRSKREAIFESLVVLRDSTASSVPFFSYPNGNWDPECVGFLKSAGYRGAATTMNGCVEKVNPYLLNRIGCSEISSNTANLFWFQIAKAFCDSRRNRVYPRRDRK